MFSDPFFVMFGTASYGYDVLDNLTRVTVGASAQQPARDHYYCYNAAWQLTNLKTGSCSGATVKALEYDVQGNLQQKDAQAYVFDLGNRLRETAGKEKYRYDAYGRRVHTLTSAGVNSVWQYSSSGQLMYSHDARNNRQTNYIYLGGSLLALCTGEVIGPGDYVYEPPGNTDWWKIVGDETMVALVIVMGTVEFVGPGGSVRARASASTQLAEYERHCREHGLPMHDLVER